MFNTVSDKWSPRQQRYLCFGSEFTTDIRYGPGADNVVADALSRAPPQESGTVASMDECVLTEVIDYAAMARQQATDTGVQILVAESNLQIARCELPGVDEQLIVDISTGKPRPLLPASWTRRMYDINHNLAHAGARAMRRQICDRFVWHSISRDIRYWTRTCTACQRAKVSQHVVAP